MIHNAAFQIELLAVAALYCLVIYHFRGEVAACLKSVAGITVEDSPGMERERMSGGFSGTVIVLASLVTGLAAVKSAAVAGMGDAGIPTAGNGVTGFAGIAALAVAMVAAGIALLKFGFLKAAGGLTFSREFTDGLVNIRRTHIAVAAVLFTPLMLILSGVNPVRDRVTTIVAAVVIVALAVSLAVQSAIAFRKQKVSILVWFLYLCAVEIFPVGFALLLAIKNA